MRYPPGHVPQENRPRGTLLLGRNLGQDNDDALVIVEDDDVRGQGFLLRDLGQGEKAFGQGISSLDGLRHYNNISKYSLYVGPCQGRRYTESSRLDQPGYRLLEPDELGGCQPEAG